MTNNFTIQAGTFEGPFDLLLTLIEKKKMHIGDVSLSQVADEYIRYVNSQEDFPVDETANFIVVAATLLLIKSKALLPILELTEEEEEDVEDLEKRLTLYKKIRRIALLLGPHWNKRPLAGRAYVPPQDPGFAPSEDLTIENLSQTLKGLLKTEHTFAKPLPKVKVQKVVSLEEMMDRLAKRIEKSLSMSFTEFSGMGKVEKVEVVVSFLAMLELVKQGVVRVQQTGAFQDIALETTKVTATPKYD